MVAYNNKKYYIDIIETKPSNAISIIETDCEMDFAPPLDYKEPEKPVSNLPNKATAEGYTLDTYNPHSLKIKHHWCSFAFILVYMFFIMLQCFLAYLSFNYINGFN